MKSCFFLLLLLWCNLLAFPQVTLDNAAERAAKDIAKLLKSRVPENSKISALMLHGCSGSSDTMKTVLGMRLASKISAELSKLLNNKSWEIIPVDFNNIEKEARKGTTPPADSKLLDEFYTNFNKAKKPDYFITGKYRINEDYSTLQLSEINLVKNTYNFNIISKSVLTCDKFTVNIITSEIDELKKLNVEITPSSDYCTTLMNWHPATNAGFFTFSITDTATNKIITESDTLYINSNYFFWADIKSPCYIYIFTRQPCDKSHPDIYSLYPTTGDKPKLLPIGKTLLTQVNTSEPAGETFYKVIASKEPLFIKFTSAKDSEGYILNEMNNADSEFFLTQLKNFNNSGKIFDCKLFLYTIQ